MEMTTQAIPGRGGDVAWAEYTQSRIAHWNRMACRPDSPGAFARGYHARVTQVIRHLVAPGLRVLELGCGRGDLLAALQPSVGVGIDFSSEIVEQARRRYPDLTFSCLDAHDLSALKEPFDVVILSDLVNDVWDVQTVLEAAASLCRPSTRLVLSFHSRLWWPILQLARRLGLATPVLPQNWLTVEDVANILELSGFEVLHERGDVLLPAQIPVLSQLANRWLVRIWPFRALALTHFMSARPRTPVPPTPPVVSVIVPARNEAGNIESILRRTPEMGRGTELIFVEGHSTDNTYAEIEAAMLRHPGRRCRLLRQTGKGKGDAVQLGFAQAAGEVLMILDADLTVPPESLPRFLDQLVSRKAEFVNGVRLVYPMEKGAMRFFNQIGNKFFSMAFSWMLDRPIKDTLCGTKVLWKDDYARLAANRAYFGDFDPFGDFDLIFGAAKLNLKMVDMPVRYRERTYGTTNIQRWKHGLLLLRMVMFAARRIKFV